MVKPARSIKIEPASLVKGQVWSVEDKRLEVKHVGKHLVEFILVRQEVLGPVHKHIRAIKQLESITTVLDFLKSHKGVLQNS